MNIYLDNAATTPVDPDVFEAMKPYFLSDFGNPSSTHAHGRKVRSAIEFARKQVAQLLNVTPGEIFFTSGGTEADNTLICSCIDTYNLSHAITTKIEHHAVLHTLENLEQQGKIKLSYVALDEKGHVDMQDLEKLLKENERSLVSIMHANNEIGNLNDIDEIGVVCAQYKAIFHSDTVQTVGHYQHNLRDLNVHCITGAAHKFHGPKGIGFMYINKNTKINPFIYGGAQERNMRGGTENVPGIIGLAKALEIAYQEMESHQNHIQGLKDRMIAKLKNSIEGISFNGDSDNPDKSLYTVLNVSLPPSPDNDMLLFTLDINGISASGGSACSSGASTGSHVLGGINADPERGAVRFSFSKYNTAEEIDFTVEKLAEFYNKVEA
ncbi:cysteine desulfurase family protein [Fulvivirga sediminis]|uniref:cysteine desulfurase n=1 Tax=Fulvivirga sediminis TaxID=2803949 RepID=A0A937K0K4_9BACT|nr:cysteine desulfurase family protein [Fulvivirga sediminis]MBL3657729.1 cysteine desulfurase [Fulvivirga sediminis]